MYAELYSSLYPVPLMKPVVVTGGLYAEWYKALYPNHTTMNRIKGVPVGVPKSVHTSVHTSVQVDVHKSVPTVPTECSICRELTMLGKERPMFKCTHLYCSTCSTKLAERIQYFNTCKGTCPLCRATPLWSFYLADYTHIKNEISQMFLKPSSIFTIAHIRTHVNIPKYLSDLLNPNVEIPPGYEIAILSFQLWSIKQWLIRLRIDVDHAEMVPRALRDINKELRDFASITHVKLLDAIKTHKTAWLVFAITRDKVVDIVHYQHKPTPTFAIFSEMVTYVKTEYHHNKPMTNQLKYHRDAIALFAAKWLLNTEEYNTYQNACTRLHNSPWKTVFGKDVYDLDRIRLEGIDSVIAYDRYSAIHKLLITKCRAISIGTNVKRPYV